MSTMMKAQQELKQHEHNDDTTSTVSVTETDDATEASFTKRRLKGRSRSILRKLKLRLKSQRKLKKTGPDTASQDGDSDDDYEYNSETFAKLARTFSSSRWSNTQGTESQSTMSTSEGGGTVRRLSKRLSKRFSFNIFDGTNAGSGMFSAFLFDGDSEDEESDAAESRQWEHCQSIISDR